MKTFRRSLAVTAVLIFVGLGSLVYAQQASYYSFATTLTVENTSGSTLTNQAVAFDLNWNELVDNGYIDADGQDILVLSQSGGGEALVFAQQAASDPATWWVPVTSLADGSSASFTLYTGQTTTTADNPQHLWLQGASESVDVSDAASLDITRDLTLIANDVTLTTIPVATTTLIGKDRAYEIGIRNSDEVFAHVVLNSINLADSSPNQNDLDVLSGAPSLVEGQLDGAADLDGTSDAFNAGDDASLGDIFAGGGTVEFWVNVDAVSNDRTFLSKKPGSFNWQVIQANTSGGSTSVEFEYGFDTNDGTWRTTNREITTGGGWQHVAIVYDSDSDANDPVIYIDGSSVGVTETSTPSGTRRLDSNADLWIGRDSGIGDSSALSGQIDDIRVWDATRTSDQIDNNKGAELTGSEANLAAYWKLNGNEIDVSYDGLISDTEYDFAVTYDTSTLDLWVDDLPNGNYVRDASFEAAVDPLDDWTSINSGGASGTNARSTEQALYGDSSLKLEPGATAFGGSLYGHYQDIAVTAGQVWSVKANALVTALSDPGFHAMWLRIEWFDSGSNSLGTSTDTITSTDAAWQSLELVNRTAPANAVTLRVYTVLRSNNAGDGATAYVDGISAWKSSTLLSDSFPAATVRATQTIDTNSNDVVIGDGPAAFHVGRTRIGGTSVQSPTYVLDLDYEPDQSTETQEGTGGNSWTWQGTIEDQSASGNDATYTFVRDMSNLARTVGPISAVSAAASTGGETDPTFVDGSATIPVTDPYGEGNSVSDFGFPFNLIATSASAGSVPLMLLAGTLVAVLAILAGFGGWKVTRMPGVGTIGAMVIGGVMVYITPMPNITIVLLVISLGATTFFLDRPFEAR